MIPSHYIGIDPGLRHAGWAIVRSDGALVACGLSRGTPSGRNVAAWDAVSLALHRDIGGARADLEHIRPSDCHVTIELPRIYAAGKMKGDPDDIVILAAVVGVIVGRFGIDFPTTTVRPAEWKGQIPKDVHHARILRGLDKKQRAILDGCGAPKSLLHNVIDAIGLAQYAARRALGRVPGEW